MYAVLFLSLLSIEIKQHTLYTHARRAQFLHINILTMTQF
jgi:hypothetical protein